MLCSICRILLCLVVIFLRWSICVGLNNWLNGNDLIVWFRVGIWLWLNFWLVIGWCVWFGVFLLDVIFCLKFWEFGLIIWVLSVVLLCSVLSGVLIMWLLNVWVMDWCLFSSFLLRGCFVLCFGCCWECVSLIRLSGFLCRLGRLRKVEYGYLWWWMG